MDNAKQRQSRTWPDRKWLGARGAHTVSTFEAVLPILKRPRMVRYKYKLDLDRDLVSEDAGIWLQASDESTHYVSDTLRSILVLWRDRDLTIERGGKKYHETRSGRLENAFLQRAFVQSVV